MLSLSTPSITQSQNHMVFSWCLFATRLCGGHGFSQRNQRANQSRSREHDFTVSWQGKPGQIGDGWDGAWRKCQKLGTLTLVGRVYGLGKEKPFLQRIDRSFDHWSRRVQGVQFWNRSFSASWIKLTANGRRPLESSKHDLLLFSLKNGPLLLSLFRFN